jgi:cold shock CspA family protein
MPTGTVKCVYAERGFLFIRRHDGHDLFAHIHCCDFGDLPFDESLTEMEVEFVEGTDRVSGKPRALNVRRRDA